MDLLIFVGFLFSLLATGSSQDGAAVCSYSVFFKRSDCRPSVTGGFKFYTIPTDLPSDVEIIVMAGNEISMLYPGNFTFYKNLTTLHLNDTLISSFPAGLANTTSTIENLFLDGAPLSHIDDGAFENFSNLRILSLKRSSLTTLRANMFTGLSSIEELYVDESPINSLPNNLFSEIARPSSRLVISLTYLQLQTISIDVFDDDNIDLTSPLLEIYLANNPWSCDCNLVLFRGGFTGNFPKDSATVRCQWPVNSIISSLPLSYFSTACYGPNVTEHPQNASILTDRAYVLTCIITGSPFPSITWLKDGVPLNYTDRLYLNLYNASLHIANVELSDAGVYQCVLENERGMDNSSEATLIVQEATCFDGVLSSHETDVDCGGIYCDQCQQAQKCRMDTDCGGSLVCLYSHSLPSFLHYISPNHYMAYTCDLPQVPRDLLHNRIQDFMTSNIFNFNFTVDTSLAAVQDTMAELLAQQLLIPVSAISDVRVTTVERSSAQSAPLIQIWFSLFKNSDGYRGRENLQKQVNNGEVKGTVKITEKSSLFSARINI